MKHLSDYIYQQLIYDGHIHLFDEDGGYVLPWVYGVGFADWDVLHPQDGVIYEKYGEYMDLHQTFKLLATAPTPEETIKIHNAYNLDGYGEIKMYDQHEDGTSLPYKDWDMWAPVFEDADAFGCPVYIHYTINEKQDALFLGAACKKYPNAKFVICHCGTSISQKSDDIRRDAIRLTVEQYKTHPNLWLDCSWTACEMMRKYPELISQIPTQRLILGSDVSPRAFRDNKEGFGRSVDNMKWLTGHVNINNETNLMRLFE